MAAPAPRSSPSSRTVQTTKPATAFALIQAAAGNTAVGCSIAPTNAPAGTAFTYQQTNAANVPIGTPNTPVDIPGGEFRTFVIALTPSQAFAATDITFAFDCTNTPPAPDTPGVNRLLLTSSSFVTPDIIAIAVAVGGIVSMPVGGRGALARSPPPTSDQARRSSSPQTRAAPRCHSSSWSARRTRRPRSA